MKDSSHSVVNVIIAYHEVLKLGPAHDLRDYFLFKKAHTVLFISHPLLYNDRARSYSSHFEIYNSGRKEEKSAYHWILPDVFLYIKDFCYSVYWSYKYVRRAELFIGLDPLNALSGLVLRSLGRVEKVVYYSIDYFTKRFQNTLMNSIYHSLDKFCVAHSDETWNVSGEMQNARKKYNNMDGKKYERQYTVPIAINRTVENTINHKRERNRMVFIGYLIPANGVDIVLQALPTVIKKIPTIHLDIIGGGPAEKQLQGLVIKYKLRKYVSFLGWVDDKQEIRRLLSKASVGLALFNTSVVTDEIKNADPAKIKDYMMYGLPVITTKEVFYWKKIEKEKCGVIVSCEKSQIAEGILSLLANPKKLSIFRTNALRFVEQYEYRNLYAKHIGRLLNI